MTDPNGNPLTKEEQEQIREVLGDQADDYIWDEDD